MKKKTNFVSFNGSTRPHCDACLQRRPTLTDITIITLAESVPDSQFTQQSFRLSQSGRPRQTTDLPNGCLSPPQHMSTDAGCSHSNRQHKRRTTYSDGCMCCLCWLLTLWTDETTKQNKPRILTVVVWSPLWPPRVGPLEKI